MDALGSADGQFDDGARPAGRCQPNPRSEPRSDGEDAQVPVDEDGVDGEAHEEHMDG